MKNILMILLMSLFFGTTSHAAAKYFCSMSEVRFNDDQDAALFKGVLFYIDRWHARYVEVRSYQEYLGLYNRYCVGVNTPGSGHCSLSFRRDLETVAVKSSKISYKDCLDRLLRPAEAVSRVCRKEFFTAQNLISERRSPKIGQIKILFGRSAGDILHNPQVLQAPVDCQYF